MTTVAIPLRSIAQQIEQHESELERLRQVYQTRQAQLAELRRRREELEAELHELDTEIEAAEEGEEAAQPAGVPRPVPVKASSVASPTLPAFLVTLIQDAGRPMTSKELAHAVAHRKFPTKSNNINHLVQNQVQKMVKRGILTRPEGQLGYVVGKPSQDKRGATSTSPATWKNQPNKASPKKSPHVPSNGPTTQRPLQEVVTQVLRKSKRLLTARELADQVQAAGYRTASKSFVDIIWVTLPKMKNVERIEGKGYRLKRGQG